MRHLEQPGGLEEARRSNEKTGRATESKKEPGGARTSEKQAQAPPAGGGLSGFTKPQHSIGRFDDCHRVQSKEAREDLPWL